jgi:putative membrane protein
MSEDHKNESDKRTKLALERTIIAEERTLMAWIRTSLSLIGFGFTIFKFFQYLGGIVVFGHVRTQAPRNLGMTLILLGTLALIVAAWQHRTFLNQLEVNESRHLWSLSFIVAIFVILIGVIALVGVFSGQGPY